MELEDLRIKRINKKSIKMKKFKFTVNGKEYEVEVKKYEGENAEVTSI